MKRKRELPETEPVRLRPVFGMRPGLAILIAIILIAAAAIFAIFFLPGLLAKGGYASFSLNTDSAAIYMDGRYIGSGKGSVYYLPAGSHRFSFSVYGVDAGYIDAEIEKKVFASLFSRRPAAISYEIENTAEIENAVISTFASQIASWSRVTDFSDRYHCPPLFQDLAEDAVSLGFADISDAMLYGALHITSETIYEDYLKAVGILSSSSVSYQSAELEMLDGVLAELYGNGSADDGSMPGSIAPAGGTADGAFIAFPRMEMSVGSTSSTAFPEVKEHYKEVSLEPFAIASMMVSEYDYALFAEENPYWAKSNTETLVADGMADENYLAGIRLSANVRSSAPIRNISYEAAEAYAAWLSEKEGADYSLPDEYQWMAASEGGSLMWEFTSSPFIPYGRLVSDETLDRLAALFPYDDVIVKGRDRETVGALDRSQTSEYCGFRIVRNGN